MTVINLPERGLERLISIDLSRYPDGSIRPTLYDMPIREIERTGKEVPDRLRIIAGWLLQAHAALLAQAAAFEETNDD